MDFKNRLKTLQNRSKMIKIMRFLIKIE